MIKRINKYLLENYPLIWNTRVVWMLIILCFAHLIFYLAGFLSYYSPNQLHSYIFDNYFSGGFIWIGILLSILIFILWLNQYFKQNAFKLYYPKSNGSLFLEFIIVFVVCFFSISFYLSYTEGLRQRISGIVSTDELYKEADIVNKTAAFTVQNSYYYTCTNRCVPALVFDTLVSEDEVLELYVWNITRYDYDQNWKNVDPEEYMLYRDSLPQPYYSNHEFEELLKVNFPQRRISNVDQDYYDDDNEYGTDEEIAVQEKLYLGKYDKNTQYNLYSLYNYCACLTMVDSVKNAEYYAKHTAGLLENQNKDSIQKIISSYLQIADKYKISYKFTEKQWIDYIYNPPYYFVDHELYYNEEYDQYNRRYKIRDHVYHYNMETTMDNLLKSKNNVIPSEGILLFFYLALFFAILIYTFRTTTFRTWIISFVGLMALLFVFLAVYFFINISGNFGYNSQDSLLIAQTFVFIFIFWIFTVLGIAKRRNKLITGVALNWSIWTFPLIIPLIITRYVIFLRNSYNVCDEYGYEYSLYYQDSHYIWINNNIVELGYFNILLFLLFILIVAIPLLKKWKAMSEE
ncbi:MAG: hypothetical protein LBQ22_02325 [Bacteroidales bacterium]|jgi:hypothetical protein|nr:hypothetical protein [Bacteroidales bacterium]